MSIRFKFRSSVNFDSVDIDGRPSISVRDLRAKIVHQKNLDICQDFDLVFSDALSGQEYNDDSFQIPSGSSIIVKRVPAGTMPSALPPNDPSESFGAKDFNPFNSGGVQMDEFDDFGTDLCPVAEATLPGDHFGIDNKWLSNEKANITDPRLGFQKVESSDVSQAAPIGSNHTGNRITVQQEPNAEELMKLGKVGSADFLATLGTGLPPELKCTLCKTFFKEAVMIPCCQHSFCEKCIRLAITEKGRCPKCSSTKCKLQDLLPNLSLRQAIEHFLESQMHITGSENAFREYAPDGESGIQGKEASFAVTVVQRQPELPHSPSATGKGSNQVMAESLYEREDTSYRKSVNVGAARAVNFAASSYKGENQPVDLPRRHLHDEGWNRSLPAGRYKKGDRNCYMCGSPDHLIRDCPVASSPQGMLQTGGTPGFSPFYWSGTPIPHIRPYANLYTNPGMSLNAAMATGPHFAVPPYVPSIYGGSRPGGGILRPGVMPPPVGSRAEQPIKFSNYMELQPSENRQKVLNDNVDRVLHNGEHNCFDRHHHYGSERSHEYKSSKEREPSTSHSDESFSQRSLRKRNQDKHIGGNIYFSEERHERSSHSSHGGRDRKQYLSDRSNSGTDMRNDADGHSEDRHKHHQKGARKHHDREVHCGSDSSRNCLHTHRSDKKRRDEYDAGGSHQKHHHHSDLGSKPGCDDDPRRQHKERDPGQDARHRGHYAKGSVEKMHDDGRHMVSHSKEYHRDDHHYSKRRKVHR